ncbi:hypothetical protein DE146DRAFT_626037 [Phaeosphaeria sp. MPI-PUGE-AT-0046c]|nr:hypothetical protein DE146DRAFT_626037 [Phaeosphaeria sp. MPI-PUGE-AT-0046c]
MDASVRGEVKSSAQDTKKGQDKQYTMNTRSGKNEADKDKATSQRTDYKNAKNCTEHWEDEEHLNRNMQAYKDFKAQEAKDADKGHKRGNSNKTTSPNKKQKSSKDEPRGAAGSITRVPSVGQKVQWHSLPGYVDGEVMEVVYEDKEVDGKKVKASKEDPRVVLKSDASGKTCVHKPAVVYWE